MNRRTHAYPFAIVAIALAVPLAAQSPFRATRHAGLPAILVGDKFASGDVDGDGDVDLVVANDNSPNQLLLNDGNGRFTDATAGRFASPSPNASHSIDLADVDGDGDLDILVGNDDWLTNRVYANNGAGVFTDVTATALPVNLEFTQNQVVADFDGDGDVDWFTVDAGACHFYRNNGAGVFTDASATAIGALPATLGARYDVTPAAADVDGDGDLDVLVPDVNPVRRPFLVLNQNGVFVPSPVPLPNVTGATNWFADLDGDGDPDILADSGWTILQNQGNGTFVDVTATAFAGPHNYAIACIDVDLDGDLDLVSDAFVWSNDGRGVFTATQPGVLGYAYGYRLAVAAADFDGDGDVDLPGRPNFLRQVHAPAAPVRGSAYSVEVHAPPTSLAVAAGAFGAGFAPLGSLGVLRLDASSAVTLAVGTVGATPLTLTWTLPANPVFAGVRLHYQALVVDPALPPHLTNAIGETVQ